MNATRKQYIYELKNANISGRSVTAVTVVKTAAQAVARLRSTEMDLEKEVVLFDALPSGSLVTASRSRLEVHRGFLTLSAEAPGRALLVPPVEFSRCLEFNWKPTITLPPLALRANLDQTAILFSGQRNGPFVNPTCRLQELQDAVRVELGRTLEDVGLAAMNVYLPTATVREWTTILRSILRSGTLRPRTTRPPEPRDHGAWEA
jgi:hypothetical protein